MPYVQDQSERTALRPTSPGELNFAVTKRLISDPDEPLDDIGKAIVGIVSDYVTRMHQDRITYAVINEVVGVLTCAALEAERRDQDGDLLWLLTETIDAWYAEIAAPYEDLKCAVNGDVYA